MWKGLVVLFVCLMVGGCTTLDGCTVHGYPYWTGSTWAVVNPYRFYYYNADKVVCHIQGQFDFVTKIQPAEFILPSKPNIPAGYYKKPAKYYFVR